jgi:hypothetical protein
MTLLPNKIKLISKTDRLDLIYSLTNIFFDTILVNTGRSNKDKVSLLTVVHALSFPSSDWYPITGYYKKLLTYIKEDELEADPNINIYFTKKHIKLLKSII